MTAALESVLRFGRHELRLAQRQLLVDGLPAGLGARAFDVLAILAQRRDRVVGKQELLDLVWPNAVVVENNLPAHVSVLRKLLGPHAISTVPGRGYRFTAVLDAEPEPPAAAAATAAPPIAAPPLRTNLPERLEPLIGRDDDLVALDAVLERHALTTIVGAGGIGKTRLAQALLHARRTRYAHGVCWVELGAVTDPQTLPDAIAAALGVPSGNGDPLQGLVSALAPLAVLVALDNAEHLLDAVAQTAQALHTSAPRVRLLVTSQAPLRLPAERLYRLGALSVPPDGATLAEAESHGAVALLVERAQAVDRRFALTADNVSAATAVCRRLDGVALAIELAAARIPLIGLSTLAASLDQRLQLLAARNPHAPVRQQTLRGAIEWSHGLLDAPEQTVFRRLAVFVGGCSLALAQQVVPDAHGQAGGIDAWAMLEALGHLADRSLVSVSEHDPPRYRLLDTPRAYALEQLDASCESDALQRRHAQAIAAHFDAAWRDRWSGGIGVDAWQAAIEPELDNGRKAFAWARDHAPALALAIVATLLRAAPVSLYGERVELAAAAEALVASCGPGAGSGPTDGIDGAQLAAWRARAQYQVGWVWGGARVKRAPAAAALALQAYRATDDRRGLYLALAMQAYSAYRLYDAATAAAALAEMQAVEDPAWPPQLLGMGMVAAAGCAMLRGEPAVELLRGVLSLNRAAGDSSPTGLARLVDAEVVAGQLEAAVHDGNALIAQLKGSRHASHLALAYVNQAGALLLQGDTAAARDVVRHGWPQAVGFGLQPFWGDYLTQLSALEQRPRAAALLCGYADICYVRCEEVRAPTEANARRFAEQTASAALGDVAFAQLRERGSRLCDEEALALALASTDAA